MNKSYFLLLIIDFSDVVRRINNLQKKKKKKKKNDGKMTGKRRTGKYIALLISLNQPLERRYKKMRKRYCLHGNSFK